MDSTPLRLLMCRATYYGLLYEINPWMHQDNQPDRFTALAQQNEVVRTLQRLGHQIEFIEPDPDNPDMCFAANSGVVRGNKVMLANLPMERKPETPLYKAWFEAHGFATRHTEYRFGGGGDALWLGDRLIAGFGPTSRRATDLGVHAELADYFGVEVTSVQATDPRFYDLDMSIGVLSPELLPVSRQTLDAESNRKLDGLGIEIIDVTMADALGFGCNLLSDGANVIISDHAPDLIHELKKRGFNVLPHRIDQFMLTGGGVRCLSLNLPQNK